MLILALVSYIRDNGAMNAVICTDGTCRGFKEVLANVPERIRTSSLTKEAHIFIW
jgi:carbamoyl-phosphate synthase small subunit